MHHRSRGGSTVPHPFRPFAAVRSLLIAAVLCLVSAIDASSTTSTRPATAPSAASRSLLDGLEFFILDAPHSPLEFNVAWMGLSKVRGTFDDCLGTIVLDGGDFTRSTVSILIHTSSLHTGNAQRDQDLRGPDWFDVKKFPTAMFHSTSITKEASGYRMHGTLTLRGITKELDFPFTYSGRLVRANHEVRIGCEGNLTLSRQDFGLIGPARLNVMTEMGKAMISDAVELPISIEGWRQTARDTFADAAVDSLARRIAGKGFDPVAREYRSQRAQTPDSLMAVNEATLNSLGFGLLEQGKPTTALQAFELEAEAYPHTGFAFVGLAQTYATLGDRERAASNAEQALAINPQSMRAAELLRHLRPITSQ
jgi:polyisoprenoid-binding protein YceI